MDGPRESMIHPSLNRPRLVLGGDRELVLCTGLLSAVLIFTLMTWWSIIVGIVLWMGAVGLLSLMGKADPLMRGVYLRHVQYQPFYAAKSHIQSPRARLPRAWR